MKLKLSFEKDVQILCASESMVPKDILVLKAGITQLFKNGKNKIILELANPSLLSNEVIRELAVLDILARELSGRIVLVSADPQTKTKIEMFAKPPVIGCFPTREAAIKHFWGPPKSTDPAVTAAAAANAVAKAATTTPPATATKPTAAAQPIPTTPAPATKPGAPATKPGAPAPAAPAVKPVTPAAAAPSAQPAPAAAPAEPAVPESEKDALIKQLKEQLRQRETGELGTLRKQLAETQSENNAIKEQLLALIIERRIPPNSQAYDEKIKALETQLEQLLSQTKDAKKSGAPA